MKKWLLCITYLMPLSVFCQTITDPHSLSQKDNSPQYSDVMDFYKSLAVKNSTIRVQAVGPTDADEPLSVVYYAADSSFDVLRWKEQGKVIILINNGIHPGEPDGIVASMQLLWDAVEQKIAIPPNVVLAIIPTFNISGAQRQREYSRANQNGPQLTGFRGNAQNLDLNRDFIKTDARETRSMIRLFRLLDPDILIDNHVSNGADYQHVMTLLSTQHTKLGGAMGAFLKTQFEPALYTDMKSKGYSLIPYVNVWGKSPEIGWKAFIETPRFFSGYAAVFHTYAFVAETHMLKPYAQRIAATYELMNSIMKFASDSAAVIHSTRLQQMQQVLEQKEMDISWTVDTTKFSMIELQGFRSGYKPSDVSGKPRLFYDRTKPFVQQVPYYDTCVATQYVTVPQAYVIPKGWNDVILKLKQSGVQIEELSTDTTMLLSVYYISDYTTTEQPYEGHYLHSDVDVNTVRKEVALSKGDYIIKTQQPAKRFIVEVLEPTATDAFFAWGTFDAVLQQKEYYSAYVFEDVAAQLLKENATLQQKFALYKKNNPNADGRELLHFIYQNSPYHEPEHMRYPIFRLE